MQIEDKCHFYSIAPEFGIYDHELDQTYHYTNHQLRLQAAAMELGHAFTIVAPTTCSIASPGVVRALPLSSEEGFSPAVGRLIQSLELEDFSVSIVILIYEGSLAIVEELLPLAKQFENISFLINLFLYEPACKLDSTFGVFEGSGSPDVPSSVGTSRQGFLHIREQLLNTGNLHFFAETESKRFAARLLGMPPINRWHPFSAIFDVCGKKPKADSSNPKYRILVPLSSWQLSDGLVRQMISIKKETDAHLGMRSQLEYHLTGHLANCDIKPMLLKLGDAGFVVTSASRETQDYANLFAGHDAVWLPNPYYMLQSSGKALDALVQATPIIAPIGTYGWLEQNRWVAGAPGYTTAGDALNLFLNLQHILPAIETELGKRNKQIREYYSPSKTISSLVFACKN